MSSLVIVGSRPCSVAPVASGGRGALRPAHVVVFRGLSLAAGTIPTDSTCPALVEQFYSDDCQKVPRMSFISNALFNFGEAQPSKNLGAANGRSSCSLFSDRTEFSVTTIESQLPEGNYWVSTRTSANFRKS